MHWTYCLLLLLLLFQGCSSIERKVEFEGISGVVIDKKTNFPIEGAVVLVHWQTVTNVYERNMGPTVYVDEVVTDNNGAFEISNSPMMNVKSSMSLEKNAPVLWVLKDGYAISFGSLYHTKKASEGYRLIYSPRNSSYIEMQLTRSSNVNVLDTTIDHTLGLFLIEMQYIANPVSCFAVKTQRTLDILRNMIDKADQTRQTTGGYIRIKSIIRNSECVNSSRAREDE